MALKCKAIEELQSELRSKHDDNGLARLAAEEKVGTVGLLFFGVSVTNGNGTKG